MYSLLQQGDKIISITYYNRFGFFKRKKYYIIKYLRQGKVLESKLMSSSTNQLHEIVKDLSDKHNVLIVKK